MKILFVQIDVFVVCLFIGNLVGVMLFDVWFDDDVFQVIVQENNLFEIVFIVFDGSGVVDYELCWYMFVVEVVLCGYVILVSGYYVLGIELLCEWVMFWMCKLGILSVMCDGGGYVFDLLVWVVMFQFLLEIVVVIGVVVLFEMLWYDSGYVLIVVEDEVVVCVFVFDMFVFCKFGLIVVIVIVCGMFEYLGVDFVSCVFMLYFDIFEDLVMGLVYVVVVFYWVVQFGCDMMIVYQVSVWGGYVGCCLLGDWVVLLGKCVMVIEGVFSFQSILNFFL